MNISVRVFLRFFFARTDARFHQQSDCRPLRVTVLPGFYRVLPTFRFSCWCLRNAFDSQLLTETKANRSHRLLNRKKERVQNEREALVNIATASIRSVFFVLLKRKQTNKQPSNQINNSPRKETSIKVSSSYCNWTEPNLLSQPSPTLGSLIKPDLVLT